MRFIFHLCFHLRLSFISWCHRQVSLIPRSENLSGRLWMVQSMRRNAHVFPHKFFLINPNIGSEKWVHTFLPCFRNVFVSSNLYKWGPKSTDSLAETFMLMQTHINPPPPLCETPWILHPFQIFSVLLERVSETWFWSFFLTLLYLARSSNTCVV